MKEKELIELADRILARYEDDREYHFHQIDREWIIEAMIEFANEIRRLKQGGDGTFTLSEETINNLKSQEDNTGE